MPFLRDLVLRFVSRETAARMEAESRSWAMKCPEGHLTSIWDAGGLRYKASGRPKTRGRCPKCGKNVWMTIVRFEDTTGKA